AVRWLGVREPIPQPLAHDPHDCDREQGRLLHHEIELTLVHWNNFASGPGHSRGAAWPAIHQGHLPDDSAGSGCVDHPILDPDFDFTLEHHIHRVPLISLAEYRLTRIIINGSVRIAKQVEDEHIGTRSEASGDVQNCWSAGYPTPRALSTICSL